MAETDVITTGTAGSDNRPGQPVVIHNHFPKPPWLGRTILKTLLIVSLFFNFLAIGQYQSSSTAPNEKFVSGDKGAKSKIAIIKVDGMITEESIRDPKKELEAATEDDEVKAVVLAVSSPGGTISASDELYHAIEEFKEKTSKPVVVSMVGLAASGAYYIAMPADAVYADRSCITGSIGVIASLFDASKLAADWGIKPETIKSGPFKDSGSFLRPLTTEERDNWQKMIDSMYGQFLEVILKYRSEKIGGEEKLRILADGRVYVAKEAKESGLIDEIGYQQDAINAAAKLAKIEGKPRVITYQRRYDSLLNLFQGSASAPDILQWKSLFDTAAPQLFFLPSVVLTPRG